MSTNATQVAKGHGGGTPPLVDFGVGLLVALVWLAGTTVQVQTSEAWITGQGVSLYPTLVVLGQIVDFVSGKLPTDRVIPFTFAWGVQIALILASIGIELPRYPAWRFYGAWGLIILLIGVNSAGDWAFASSLGGWASLGFTMVSLFVTFLAGFLAILCFMRGINKMRS